MHVSYRDLVTNAEAVVSQIGAFAGHDLPAGDVRRATDALHKGSLGAWKSRLTPQQIADIETICGPLMTQLDPA